MPRASKTSDWARDPRAPELEGQARQSLLATAAEGFCLNASIEARPLSEPRLIKAGETRVNGQDIAGPAWLVSQGELYGVAFVPFGADERTKRCNRGERRKNGGAKSMDFASWWRRWDCRLIR